jgi:hypothetical protein
MIYVYIFHPSHTSLEKYDVLKEKGLDYFVQKKNVNIILKNLLQVLKECVVVHLIKKNVKKMIVIAVKKG